MPRSEQQLPYSTEAEKSILSAMLMDDDSLNTALDLAKSEYFYNTSNQHIFDALNEIYERGDDIDPVTLADQLESDRVLDDVGGMGYIGELIDFVGDATSLKSHIKLIREKYQRRCLIDSAQKIMSEAQEAPTGAIDEILDRSENRIFKISEEFDSGGPTPASSIIKSTMDDIDERINSDSSVTGVHTGIDKLDRNTGGLKNSELVVVAGRPSMGKTAFAINVAQNAALGHGVPVGVFSLEMEQNELMKRMLSSHAKVDGMKLRNGDLNEREIDRLTEASETINDAPIYIDDTPSLSILELRAKARRLKKKEGLGLVVIDYLQLMRGSRTSEQRYLEVGEMSRGAKVMARELDIPVILISQLSRAPEKRNDPTPRLSDLRESGDIEQDADIVLFIFRQEVYDGPRSADGKDLRGKADIIIGKQRNGPIGKVETHFVKEFTKFEEI